MCMHAAPHRKRTLIPTNIPQLESLSRRCNHNYKHAPLSGSERIVREDGTSKWVSKTSQAGIYPADLCASWATILARIAPSEAYGETPAFAYAWKSELGRCLVASHVEAGAEQPRDDAGNPTVAPFRSGDDVCTSGHGECEAASAYIGRHPIVFGNSSLDDVRRAEEQGHYIPRRG